MTTWHRWGIAGVLMAAATIGIVLSIILRPKPYAVLLAKPAVAPSAFETGGRPEPAPTARDLFETLVPNWSIALDRWLIARGGRSELQETHALAVERAEAVLGADPAHTLDLFLSGCERVDAENKPADTWADELTTLVLAFDETLARRNFGYWVDVDVLVPDGRVRVVTETYSVERVTLFHSAGDPVRALDVRRVDHLNLEHSLLGVTSARLHDGIVFLDHIDQSLVLWLGTSLAVDGGASLPAGPRGSWVSRLEKRAGARVRSDLADGLDPERAPELGALFFRRHALFDEWSEQLRPRGLAFVDSGTYRLDMKALEPLRAISPDGRWRELASIDDQFGQPSACRTFLALEERVARSVRRHESQHRIDLAAHRLDATTANLAHLLPPGQIPRWQYALTAELSAYLSQVARADATGGLELTMLLRFALSDEARGTPEWRASIIIFEGLARELADPGPPLIEQGQLQAERVAEAYLQLASVQPAPLRAAAARLWEKLYGTQLPPLVADRVP